MAGRRWFANPYDLRQAFLVGVLLPLAGLSATVVLGVINWAERSLEDRLKGEIELISHAVAPGISSNLGAGRNQEIRASLNSLFSIRQVYGAAIYDHNGDLVVAAGTADQNLRSSKLATDVVRTGEDGGYYRNVAGRHVYSYFSPLLDHGGRIHGLLQITRDRREIDASVRELRTLAWSFWLFAVVTAVVLTLVLYRRLVGRHVHGLLDRMSALAAGDRGVTYQATAPREFVKVAAGFNSMVRSIAGAEHELRQRQQRERDLERELRESEKIAVVGRVAQGLAHELGSPLSVIEGRVRRMQRLDEQGRYSQALEDVRRQATRMAEIVRQLLSYGQTESGRRVEMPLAGLVERVLHHVEGDRTRITFHTPEAGVCVLGDPVRLELAIANLVRNAVRHARSRVDIGIFDDTGHVCLFVEDDGEGVSAEDRPHVFQPFFTRQPPGSGTGLGLAIVASVMREHDGDVRYEPGSGGGARFVLRFAAATAPAVAAATATAPAVAAATRGNPGPAASGEADARTGRPDPGAIS